MEPKRVQSVWTVTALALVVALLLPWAAFATVSTDQQDYSPGSVVTISGGNDEFGAPGYWPGEAVHVTVTGPHDPAYAATTCDTVQVAQDGSWACTVTLWADADWAEGDYAYTATSTAADGSPIEETGAFTDTRTITNATLTAGGTTVPPGALTVAGGATISATVTAFVTALGNRDWKSTSYKIIPTPINWEYLLAHPDELLAFARSLLEWTCVEHGNHSAPTSYPYSATFNETFDITAPPLAGQYTVFFVAHAYDACVLGSGLPSNPYWLGNSILVSPPPPATGSIVVEKQTDPDGATESFEFAASWSLSPLYLTDGQQLDSGQLIAGTYTLAEQNLPAGWEQTSGTCSDGSEPSSIELTAGEVVTCTFENTQLAPGKIIIEKQTEPDGSTLTFEFDPSWSDTNFFLMDGQQHDSGNLVVGTYSVAEVNLPTGWQQAPVTCSDGSDPSAIDLGAGETVTCVFGNNELPGTLVVEKQTEPAGAIAQFEFTGDAAGTIADGERIVVSNLAKGVYSSTELLPSCPAPVIDCPGGGCPACSSAPLPTITRMASTETLLANRQYLVKGPTATIKSKFATRLWMSAFEPSTWSVALVKPAANTTWTVPDGAAWRVVGGWRVPFVMHSPLGEPPDVVSLGVYDAGWQISAQVLDHLNNIYQGVPRPAEIYLVTANGSELQLPQLSAPNGSTWPALLATADPARVSVTVPVRGEVRIRTHDSTVWWLHCQPPPCPAWQLTAIDCDDPTDDSSGDLDTRTATFALAAGETVTCTFSNEQQGTIIVEKQTLPDGSPVEATFTGDVSGTAWDGWHLVRTVAPGSYSSTELVPAGWELESIACIDPTGDSSVNLASATASFEVAAGETVKCIFTDKKWATLIVEKQTLPDKNTTGFLFSGDAAGTIADGGQIVLSHLAPGTYSSSEAVPPGWALTSIVCDDPLGDSSGDLASGTATFTLDWGETVKCTFTNTKYGTLIVEKQTLPDGDPQPFPFSGTAAGAIADGQQIIVPDLLPGLYSAQETLPAGWTLTSIKCQDPTANSNFRLDLRTAYFRVGAGETVKCTFTNTKLGTIIVEKQTVPDGNPTLFRFSGTVYGTIADGGQLKKVNLKPGTYSSTETLPTGWGLTSIVCDDANSSGSLAYRKATFRLEAGETVTCTFTNTKK